MTEEEFAAEAEGAVGDAQASADGSPEQQTGQPQVNLDDLPEFRSWKSSADKTASELRSANQQLQQQLQQLATQLGQVQTEWNNSRMQDMSPEERTQWQIQQYEQERTRLQQELEQERIKGYQQQVLSTISSRTGHTVPELRAQIANVESVDELWSWALDNPKKRRRSSSSSNGSQHQEQSDNRVDTGGGTPPAGEEERLTKLLQKAHEDRDMQAFMRLSSEMIGKGFSVPSFGQQRGPRRRR